MRQEMNFTENEAYSNPLYRKMRERFICNGHMTIGEIMLHRAQKDGYADGCTASVAATVGYQTPVVTAKTTASRPEKNRKSLQKRRENKPVKEAASTAEEAVTSKSSPKSKPFMIALCMILCAVILLAIIIPNITRISVNDADASKGQLQKLSASADAETPDNTEAAPVPRETSPSFDNVMDAFSRSFGN